MVKKWSEMSAPVAACQRCDARLADGKEAAFATLRVAEDEGAVRREDLCRACFEAMEPRPATYWRRAARPPAVSGGPRDGKRARTERLLDLFRELDEPASAGEDPTSTARRKLRYLTALALVRRRRLTLLESEHRDGTDTLIVRRSGAPERILVECPRLDPQELEPLLASLGRALEGDATPPPRDPSEEDA